MNGANRISVPARKIAGFAYQGAALALGAIIVFPVLYALSISFMAAQDILSKPPRLLPKALFLGNYVKAITGTMLFRYMLNSLFMATVVSVARVATASLAAFGFSFFRFPGRDALFMFCLGTMMIPGDIVIVSNYATVSKLGLVNTYLGMMIVFLVSAVNVFVMRQHFMGFSKSLREAAYIDGCGNFRFFLRILMPTSTPVITTVFISAFINTWNTYLWPLLVTHSEGMP